MSLLIPQSKFKNWFNLMLHIAGCILGLLPVIDISRKIIRTFLMFSASEQLCLVTGRCQLVADCFVMKM